MQLACQFQFLWPETCQADISLDLQPGFSETGGMIEILGLILPLFGLILLGFAGARITKQPIEALGWLNTFIIYFALPALFFKLLAKTPVEQLASWQFIFANIGVTYAIFIMTFGFGLWNARGNIAEATVQGLAGAYGNIGYMKKRISIRFNRYKSTLHSSDNPLNRTFIYITHHRFNMTPLNQYLLKHTIFN